MRASIPLPTKELGLGRPLRVELERRRDAIFFEHLTVAFCRARGDRDDREVSWRPACRDLPAGAVDRAERKRLATEGKLPLPAHPIRQLDERLASHHVTRDASIMIRIFKAELELEAWMTTNTGEYTLFATHPVRSGRERWTKAQGG